LVLHVSITWRRSTLKIVCTSDTHNKHRHLSVPDGDVLVVAGDISDTGRKEKLEEFNEWLGELPHKYKLVVSGNHDLLYEFDHGSMDNVLTNATYLENSEVTIEGLRIWGVPWKALHFGKKNNIEPELVGKTKWDLVPDGIDILITHIPPHGIRDTKPGGRQLGSEPLLEALKRVKPRYHIFGHVHDQYGWHTETWDQHEIIFVNAAAIIDFGNALNPPLVFEI